MFVLGNVIKPQGLEPLQFPTKFRAPSEHADADSELPGAGRELRPDHIADLGGFRSDRQHLPFVRVKGGPKLDQSGGGTLDHPAARWRV